MTGVFYKHNKAKERANVMEHNYIKTGSWITQATKDRLQIVSLALLVGIILGASV